MYKTILVPLDGSQRAERVLAYVEELARRCEAEVVLLTVAEPSPFAVGSQEAISVLVYQQEVEHLEDEAEAFISRLFGESSGGKVCRLAPESPADRW